MKLKLKPTVVYKKDRDGTGFLFSLGDDSNKLIKVSGLIDEIVQQLVAGTEFEQIKLQILKDYDVDEQRFLQDVAKFSKKLKELNFLD